MVAVAEGEEAADSVGEASAERSAAAEEGAAGSKAAEEERHIHRCRAAEDLRKEAESHNEAAEVAAGRRSKEAAGHKEVDEEQQHREAEKRLRRTGAKRQQGGADRSRKEGDWEEPTWQVHRQHREEVRPACDRR